MEENIENEEREPEEGNPHFEGLRFRTLDCGIPILTSDKDMEIGS